MYEWLKSIILPLLRIDAREPHPPAGQSTAEIRRIERAAPGYLRLKLFWWGVYAVAWAFAVVVASSLLLAADPRLLWLVIPLVAVAIAKAATLYVTMRLDYELRWYVLTDRGLMIREGVWNVKEITLTYANAQNVRVTQGPLERLFGYSTVEVETAGGGSGENGVTTHMARLPGLSDPHELRDLILAGVRHVGTAGLGDLDDQHRRAIPPGATGEANLLGDGHTAPARTDVTTALQQAWDEARALRAALQRTQPPASE